jgi:hypothetical protein
MNALANGFSHPGSFARFAPAEWGGTPHTSTLAKARASVKNSHAVCCASANAFLGEKETVESTLALLGCARMPFRSKCARQVVGAPGTVLLRALIAGFIPAKFPDKVAVWFCGRCVHRILRGIDGGTGTKHSAARLGEIRLLHAAARIYTGCPSLPPSGSNQTQWESHGGSNGLRDSPGLICLPF